jgi:hypothetical protein
MAQQWRNWGDHPFVVAISVIAGLLAIYAYFKGSPESNKKENVPEPYPAVSPTPQIFQPSPYPTRMPITPSPTIELEQLSKKHFLFKNFPVSSIFNGVTAPIRIIDPTTKLYRTRITDVAADTPVNFAGKYILETIGCGTSCLLVAAIEADTGNVYWAPFVSICCWYGEGSRVEYRRDSTLIVFRGLRNELEGDYGVHYYRMDKGFHYIKSFREKEPN